MNLKLSMVPVLDLQKRFRISLGHELIGKKDQAIKGLSVRILELRCFLSRKGPYFLDLCLQKVCVYNLL